MVRQNKRKTVYKPAIVRHRPSTYQVPWNQRRLRTTTSKLKHICFGPNLVPATTTGGELVMKDQFGVIHIYTDGSFHTNSGVPRAGIGVYFGEHSSL